MTIFNNSAPEIDYKIICFSELISLLNLSGVNRNAFFLALNNETFQRLFSIKYPALSKIKNSFHILRNFHPDNCWKVICCAYSKGVFNIDISFAKEGIPFISEFYQKEKDQIESELKEICGSSDEDPDSTINKAYKNYIICKHIYDEYRRKEKELFDPIDKGTNSDLRNINQERVIPNQQLLFSMTDEELHQLFIVLSGDGGFLNGKLIPNYISAIKFIKDNPQEKYDGIYNEFSESEKNYKALIGTKKSLEYDLKKINEPLSLCTSKKPETLGAVATEHNKILIIEFNETIKTEKLLQTIATMQNCQKIIESMICKKAALDPTVLKEVKESIDGCHFSSGIFSPDWWQAIYNNTTNGNPNPHQWSEDQLPKFVKELKRDIKYAIKGLELNLEHRVQIKKPLW